MVAMEIMHFYIVQFMFEDKSILNTWNPMNNLIDTHGKKEEKKSSPVVQEVSTHAIGYYRSLW